MRTTTALVEAHVPRVLAQLAVAYMTSAKRTEFSMAQCGEYESCMSAAFPCDALVGACRGGHLRLAKAMHAMRAASLIWPVSQECCRGQDYLKDATIWDLAAHAACEGAHIAIVHFLLAADSPFLNSALTCACAGGHMPLVRLLVNKGASNLLRARHTAWRHGHSRCAQLLDSYALNPGVIPCAQPHRQSLVDLARALVQREPGVIFF
jgi:hypothetical protein